MSSRDKNLLLGLATWSPNGGHGRKPTLAYSAYAGAKASWVPVSPTNEDLVASSVGVVVPVGPQLGQ